MRARFTLPPSPMRYVFRLFAPLIPWLLSAALHGLLATAAFWAVWSTVSVDREEIIVPIVTYSATPGAPLHFEQSERLRPPGELRHTQMESDAPSFSATQGQSPLAPLDRMGKGALEGWVPAESSPFAVAATEMAFQTSFMGNQGGNARRLVYLVDASGSLIDTLPQVLAELQRSIEQLSPQQSFTVLFFSGDQVHEPDSGGLSPATAAHKARIIAWTQEIRVHGKTNPLPALERALSYQPQLIFLLSDNLLSGHQLSEEAQDQLLQRVHGLNTARTRICTIQFLYPDPMTRLGLPGTLERLAEETGGTYRFMEAGELLETDRP